MLTLTIPLTRTLSPTNANPDRGPQRLRVVATYEAAAGRDPKILYGGLCNQIYTHVGMLAVLLQLGAEVVSAGRCDMLPVPQHHCARASLTRRAS